jgi:hypothetical protein
MTGNPRTLIWLASCPKSGNTWMRAFLANYFIDSSVPVSINEMQKISFGDRSTQERAARIRAKLPSGRGKEHTTIPAETETAARTA